MNTIKICMGSSCFARGNTDNLALIEDFIKENNLEARIELIGLRCEDKCDKGPNIIVNGIEYNGITINQLKEILSSLPQGEGNRKGQTNG